MSESKLLLVILLALKADLARSQRGEDTKYILYPSGGICVFVERYLQVAYDCEHVYEHKVTGLHWRLKAKLRSIFLTWPDCRLNHQGDPDGTFPLIDPNDYFREWDLKQQWNNPKRSVLLDYVITELRKEND